MASKTDDEVVALARAHCEYLVTVFAKAFMDGFAHGYKHGVEDTLND